MLLGTLGASLLGNMFTGKEVIREKRGYNIMNHMDKRFQLCIKIDIFFNYKPIFNGFCSRDNLPRIKFEVSVS